MKESRAGMWQIVECLRNSPGILTQSFVTRPALIDLDDGTDE